MSHQWNCANCFLVFFLGREGSSRTARRTWWKRWTWREFHRPVCEYDMLLLSEYQDVIFKYPLRWKRWSLLWACWVLHSTFFSYMPCSAWASQIWLQVSLLSFSKYRIVGDRESIEQKVSNTIPLLDLGYWRAGGVNKMCDVFLGPHGTAGKARKWGLWKVLWIHNTQQVYLDRFSAHWFCGQEADDYLTTVHK